jgi:hypothetical protein
VASSCINTTQCISPVTPSNVKAAMLNQLLGAPDFPTIFEGLAPALKGDASIFALYAVNPIPNVETVTSMPLLCNDYRK